MCAFVIVASALATPAQAQATTPEGFDQVSTSLAELGHEIDPRPSNSEIEARLADLAERSDGRVDVRTIGDSNEEQPVWAARIGTGPTRILYVSQQHGNEPLGTPAALELVRTLGVGDTVWHRWLRDQVSVEVIVRANPDGHDRDWRYNYDPEADPEYGEAGKGYDINRYHDPDVAPEDNPATEAAHIQRAHSEFDPEIVVDYHMQGRYADDDGREITASVFWPTHPDVTSEARENSQRASVLMERAMTILVPGSHVSQYPGGDYEGIARNAYGLHGNASVLLELSNMGAEHEQFQIRSAYAAMLAIVQTAADGSIGHVNPDHAHEIPPRGDPILEEDGSPVYPLHQDDLD